MKKMFMIALAFSLLLFGCLGPETEPAKNETGTTAPANQTPAVPAGPEDCATDFSCFISASEDCSEAKMTHSLTLFGQTTTSTYEIRGMDSGKCIFYIKTEKIELPEGTDQATVDAYKDLEGRDGTCKFDTADLTEMLNKWNSGQFSTSDYDKGDCSGTFFGQ